MLQVLLTGSFVEYMFCGGILLVPQQCYPLLFQSVQDDFEHDFWIVDEVDFLVVLALFKVSFL